jgi:hypothetical protein
LLSSGQPPGCGEGVVVPAVGAVEAVAVGDGERVSEAESVGFGVVGFVVVGFGLGDCVTAGFVV